MVVCGLHWGFPVFRESTISARVGVAMLFLCEKYPSSRTVVVVPELLCDVSRFHLILLAQKNTGAAVNQHES